MRNSFKFLTLFLVCYPVVTASTAVFNVVDYGAVGNGVADDTNAFAKAWEETCLCCSSSCPILKVPSEKTFLIQPLRFIGPCKSHSLTLQIDGNLVAPAHPSTWKCDANVCHQWLYFHRLDGLTLTGRGTIDGRGHIWWQNTHLNRPTIMEISNAANVHVGGGLRFKDSPMMHVVLNGIRTVFVTDVTVEAPGNSPNTDGIHIQDSTNAHIYNSTIGTGDDCIAIVNGATNVRISNIICGPGHGISIGSLGKNGAEDKVEDVRVSDVVFLGTTNGARIKTWQGGRGYARDIHFDRFLFHDTINPIIIDQFYCDHRHCTTSKWGVEISNVSYRMMVGSCGRQSAVVLRCSEAVACRDIVVEDLHIVTAEETPPTYHCANVYGTSQGHLFPQISCFNYTLLICYNYSLFLTSLTYLRSSQLDCSPTFNFLLTLLH